MEILFLISGIAIGIVIMMLYQKIQLSKNTDGIIQNHPAMNELRLSVSKLSSEVIDERKLKENYMSALAAEEQKNLGLNEKIQNQNDDIKRVKDDFTKEFENLANRIFDEKSKRITEQNKDQLDHILNPLKEKLGDFERKVEKVYSDENKERIHLKVEITKLFEMNNKLSEEANNLASALKGSNKQQGNWGEMILEKILERSGLQSGVEFQKQFSDENDLGSRIQPDVVVNLPEGKHLIIDSKVSLNAYTMLVAAESEEDKLRFMKSHVDSLRSHIKLLSEKNYTSAKKLNTPEFVLLFMPIEGAFSVALQQDSELYNYAWDRNIVLVSPTTLLATLRTIASIWTQEKRTRNAEAIAEEGGKLYDKFKGFIEDLLKVGNSIRKSQEDYSEAMKKLSEGRGNLVSRVENMKKLGAKTSQSINEKVIERSSENNFD